MEILQPEQYEEYEHFVEHHPNGSIMQSTLWQHVKAGWKHEVIVVRNDQQEIEAGMSVLVRKMPLFGATLLYAPRGPVCHYNNLHLLPSLQQGIDILAKKHNAYMFKMDPDIPASNTTFLEFVEQMGYKRFADPTGFDTIQTRFNYKLPLVGRTEDEILAAMHHKTRYNIRLAARKGVEVRVVGEEGLDDFIRIMELTGERDGFSTRPKAYFATMLQALGEHIRLYLAYFEGTAIAGAITSNYAKKTSYIYGASDNRHRNVMAPYLIQWEMIRWALESGSEIYDFMGIDGTLNENSPLYGLYRFKSGFSGKIDEAVGELDYVYRTLVHRLISLALSFRESTRRKKRSPVVS